jgi:hypothetical protein
LACTLLAVVTARFLCALDEFHGQNGASDYRLLGAPVPISDCLLDCDGPLLFLPGYRTATAPIEMPDTTMMTTRKMAIHWSLFILDPM